MAPDVLKEFLVAIGYKVDEPSQKKFTDSIRVATVQAQLLSNALELAAKAVVRAVADMAAGFEDLYFSSKRTHASVENIKAFGFAAGQLGSTAAAARQSLENLSRHMRESPGWEGILQRQGVHTRDANGAMRDRVKILEDLADTFQHEGYRKGLYPAEILGFDENTYRAMRDPRFRGYLEQYKNITKEMGFNPDTTARGAHHFMNSWRTIGEQLSSIGGAAMSRLNSSGVLQKFSQFLAQHGKQIADILSKIANAALDLAEAFLKIAVSPQAKTFLDWLDKKIVDLGNHTNLFGDILMAVFASKAMKAFGLFKGGWLNMLGGLLFTAPGAAAAAVAAGASADSSPDAATKKGMKKFYAKHPQDTGANASIFGPLGHWWQNTMPIWMGGKSGRSDSLSGNMTGLRKAVEPHGASPSGYDGFFNAIIAAEGTGKHGSPYDTSLGYMKSPKPLSQMTMNEALAWGRRVRAAQGLNSSAKGAFQVENSTQRDAMKALHMKGTDLFNEANQRRIAMWIAHKQGLGAWEGFKIHPDQRRLAANALAHPVANDNGLAHGIARMAHAIHNSVITPAHAAALHHAVNAFGSLDVNRQFHVSPSAYGPTKNIHAPTNMTTHINVTGMPGDPNRLADTIGRAQGRANSDLLRNMVGAYQ